METFFIICPIGLEGCLEQEARRKIKFPFEMSRQKGGVEIKCALSDGLSLNYHLRSASRILLRLKNQTCRDLPKLFSILSKYPWNKYLNQTNLEFVIKCSKSRLLHTGKIEATAKKALEKYFQGHPIAKYFQRQNYTNQKIYLRFEEDQLTISLDTSGEHLHKRAEHVQRVKASMRENFVAACLEEICRGDNSHSFHDPMCGSGTSLSEYFHLNQPIAERAFAFENWKNISCARPKRNKPTQALITGADLTPIKSEKFSIKKDDFFQTNHKAQVLFLNPPYGKRLKIKGNPKVYFQKIIDKIIKLAPQKAGVIIPYEFSKGLNSHRRLHFNQNGIAVACLIFEF